MNTAPTAISRDPGFTKRISRRGVLALSAAVAAGLTTSGCTGSAARVRLGTAQPGGQFHEFASALAAAAEKYSRLRIEPIVTEGSFTNLRLLARGEIDAALTLGDAASPHDSGLAIGRVYECYIQVAVRPDSPVRHLADLRGQRMDLGLVGSGSAVTGERLLRTAGITPGTDITIEHRNLSAAVRALQRREVDAILWGDEVPTPVFEHPTRLRLLDLSEWVAPMYERSGYPYDTVSVPSNTYPGSGAVDTVGVPTLLLASPDLADHAVTGIAELLLGHGDLLVPAQTIGFQFLDRRWLVGTGQVPLHAAAAAYYRAEHG
ncbi:TAXI family TRAP transporter solute-binding subunit [Nocardia sp. NPDC051750]|uniref:TAXI family TRAP transporter solute-binding subunit n=1 Tax=Nocardia sp. NPDC051750 TaxID=3364325 RepID=UPI0037BBB787